MENSSICRNEKKNLTYAYKKKSQEENLKKKYLGVSENIDQNLLDTIKNKICKGEVRSQTITMEAWCVLTP